jgi:DNA modification methylase
MTSKIIQGDCLEVLKTLEDNSVDAVVTDPPYGLSFMGKKWDYDVPSIEVWRELLRVLKPGGHLLAFAGTRTQHRMAVKIEDAGFEIRDMIAWVYGSGFPKSLNIGKAVDKINGEAGRLLKFVEWFRTTGLKQKETNEIIGKADVGSHYFRLDQPAIPTRELWAKLRPHIKIEIPEWIDELVERIEREREVIGEKIAPDGLPYSARQPKQWTPQFSDYKVVGAKAPMETKGTSAYEGWGTSLKPALEPITVARKPFAKTVAENVLEWGTGGINIDGCRVGTEEMKWQPRGKSVTYAKTTFDATREGEINTGRFPANLIHDGSEEVVGLFPYQKSGETKQIHNESSGTAARFFYCAKASKAERDAGCEGIELKTKPVHIRQSEGRQLAGKMESLPQRNHHPTVKPIALMRYLCRLVTPPNGIVLDPFTGSGTTGIAAHLEGFNFIGIEKEKEYCDIANARIKHYTNQLKIF